MQEAVLARAFCDFPAVEMLTGHYLLGRNVLPEVQELNRRDHTPYALLEVLVRYMAVLIIVQEGVEVVELLLRDVQPPVGEVPLEVLLGYPSIFTLV